MNFLEEIVFRSAIHLLLAIPNPLLWNGPAASACAKELELLAEDLRAIAGGLSSIVE